MKISIKQWVLLTLVTLLSLNILVAEPIAVGKVDYVRGVVSAESEGGEGRLLGTGTSLYEKDSIVTGNSSFAVLVFEDGTKVTVRPQSIFIISEYQFKKNDDDKALFRLLKGGMRTVTGSINKNKSEKIELITPVAKIAVRDTDFVTRLCDGDCEDDNVAINTASKTIARVALAQNNVHVKDDKGKRAVQTGYRLKEKDTVLTDDKGYAVLVFTDKTRITVQSATELNIEEFIFPEGRPKQGKALFTLVKGGARTLTGLIGKANPERFKLKTPAAVMGIRGTGFDTYYDDETYVNVWQGAVTATRNGRTQDVTLNQIFSIGESGFNELQRFPKNIEAQVQRTPRPDKVNTQSVWVSVNRGNVTLTDTGKNRGKTIKLTTGEVGTADRTQSKKAKKAPIFIRNDAYTTVEPDQVSSSGETRERSGNQPSNNSSNTSKEKNSNDNKEGNNNEGQEQNRERGQNTNDNSNQTNESNRERQETSDAERTTRQTATDRSTRPEREQTTPASREEQPAREARSERTQITAPTLREPLPTREPR